MTRLVALVALLLVVVSGGVFASASQLPVRSAALTTTMVVPVAIGTELAFTGGTVAGRAEQGDRVTITFARPLDMSTLCPGSPAAPTTVQTLATNNAVTVTVLDGGTGHDVLTVAVTGSCGGAFALGTIDLGSAAFTTGGPLTFAGNGNGGRSTVTYDPATRQVGLYLGTRGGAGTPGTVGSVTATFTPAPTLRHLDGSTPGPISTTGVVL